MYLLFSANELSAFIEGDLTATVHVSMFVQSFVKQAAIAFLFSKDLFTNIRIYLNVITSTNTHVESRYVKNNGHSHLLWRNKRSIPWSESHCLLIPKLTWSRCFFQGAAVQLHHSPRNCNTLPPTSKRTLTAIPTRPGRAGLCTSLKHRQYPRQKYLHW